VHWSANKSDCSLDVVYITTARERSRDNSYSTRGWCNQHIMLSSLESILTTNLINDVLGVDLILCGLHLAQAEQHLTLRFGVLWKDNFPSPLSNIWRPRSN